MAVAEPSASLARREGSNLPWLLAGLLACWLLLAGTALAQDQAYSLDAVDGNAQVSAVAGQRLQLSVMKKLGDQGVAGEQVDWTITDGDGARLSAASSRTTKASSDLPAGLASTTFTADRAGSFQVVASSRTQPGCSADDCARLTQVFTVTVAYADTKTGDRVSAGWLGAAAGAVALIAAANGNGGDENNTPPDQTSRGLAITSGDGQSGFANSALSAPLVVRALNNGAPASGVTINWTATGGATLGSSTSTTGSLGDASITVTNLGPGPGPVTVTATRADSSTAIVSFTLNVSVPTLDRVSGHNQTVFTGNNAAPLVVEARLSGAPQAGLGITWTVLSGSATIASVSNGGQTNALGQSSATIAVGSTPGPIQVRAARSDRPSITQTFTINATQARTLDIVSGDGQSGLTDTAVEDALVVQARTNGLPASGVTINWSVASGDAVLSAATSSTNAGGNASIGVTFGSNPGTVVITATRADDPLATTSFELTSILIRTLDIASGDNQSGAVNGPVASPLVVRAENNGNPIAGVTIYWDASGNATLSAASSVTDGSGLASVMVTSLGTSDPVTVTATRADDSDIEVEFTLDILPSVLSIVSGNNQNGLIGSPADDPLVVQLLDGLGAPVSGQAINWSVIGGSASLSGSSSTTNASGQASINFTFGLSTTPITIRASAYSGLVTVNFSADPDNSSGLIKISGDGQSAAAGTTLPIPLTVQLSEAGGGLRPAAVGGSTPDLAAINGVPVNFTVISGTAQILSSTGTTDANGEASAVVKLGLTPGTVTVRAAIPGGPSTNFTLTITGSLVPGALTIVSGNNQTLTLGTPSAPMVVELRANGSPLAGATITWSTSNGSVANSSTSTDANGRASTTVTPSASGELTVTANFPAFNEFTGTSISFVHNTTIASLPNLQTDEVAVAVALDSACGDLQGGSGLTQAQQDLLNQCLALGDAASEDPQAVAEAIQEMLPDSAQAQSQSSQAASNAQFENLTGRMTSLRAGVQGASFTGLSVLGSGGRVSLGSLAGALSADEGNDSAADTFGRWGFFMTGTIGRGDAEAGARTPSYDFDVNGITAGVDYRKSDNLVLGVALGYTNQDTTLAGGQGSVDMTGFSLSAYSTWYQQSNWYMDSVLTYARNDYDSTRLISFALPLITVNQLARASSGGTDLNASVTFGRDFNKDSLNYGFYGRAMYGRQGYDGYIEQVDPNLPGAGLALRVADRDVSSLSSVLGAKFSVSHSTNWGVFVPQFEIEWQKEYRSDAEAFQAFFVNDPSGTPIIITGEALDDSFFRAGIGFSAVMTRGRSGFLMYEHIFGRDRISQYSLALGFRVEF